MLRFTVWFCVAAVPGQSQTEEPPAPVVDVVDLTHPTTVRALAEYYGAVHKSWKICMNCGVPELGTTMHLEHGSASSQAMYPALIPTDYLITRLVVIDVSPLVRLEPALVLSLEVALQWKALRKDPAEPTLLLFQFGWKARESSLRSCVCKIPGLSFELGEWITANLTRVVGVGTDAPTLESQQTRQFNTHTIAGVLGHSGVYMMENVNIRKTLPESGCMAAAMPLKLQDANYVLSRMTAFCPAGARSVGTVGTGGTRGAGGTGSADRHVVLALKTTPPDAPGATHPRNHDLNLDDILNN